MQPSASELGTWVMVLAFVITTAGTCVMMVSSFRTQRRQVSIEDQYARKDEFDRFVNRFEEEIGQQRGEWTDEARRIYERLDRVSGQVSAVGASTELLNQRMVQIDGKLDRMIERSAEK